MRRWRRPSTCRNRRRRRNRKHRQFPQALLCGDSGHAGTLAIGGNPTALAGDLSLGLGGGGGGGGYYGGGAGGSGGCGNHGSNAGGGGGGAGSSFALATGLITNVVVATDTTAFPR